MEKVSFLGSSGEQLHGSMDAPKGNAETWAVFAHCFTCSRQSIAASRISRNLSDTGIGVLRFDFTGLGDSGGDFSDTNFSSNIADLISAVSYVEKARGPVKLMIGHSLGGAATLVAAAELPSVLGVVTIGSPYDPSHVVENFADKVAEISAQGHAQVTLAGRTFRIKKQFMDDLNAYRDGQKIRELKKALMIFHSPVDRTVGIDNAREIYQRAQHPKSFVSLDQADHLLTNRADAEFVSRMIAAWALRYF